MSLRRFLNRTILSKTKYEIIKSNAAIKKHQSATLDLNLEYIVTHRMATSDDFFILQVGANDGIGNDAVYPLIKKFGFKAILIEPLKDIFDKLQANYADIDRVTFVNKAIHNELKEMNLYRINPNADLTGLPVWATRIASFNKSVIESHKKHIPNIQNLLIKETVECISLEEVIIEAEINHIDLLQIDAEGYDYEIIKMIKFQKIRPSIIRYEHKHLSKKDFTECLELLVNNNYRILFEDSDITAYSMDWIR